MRTSLKMIAASLTLLGCANAALAQQAPQPTEWPLGMAIAYQGDQALIDIREDLKQSLPASTRQFMSLALPQTLATAATDSGYTADAVSASMVVAQ